MAAARMRAAFKSQGWGRKHVSVRSSNYSMGSSVHIEVKSGEVDERVCERVAECEESISRDQWGDILGGGNFFVFVQLDSDYRNEAAAPWVEPVTAALKQAQSPPGIGFCRNGGTFAPIIGAETVRGEVATVANKWLAELWLNGTKETDFDPENFTGAAFCVARAIAQAGESAATAEKPLDAWNGPLDWTPCYCEQCNGKRSLSDHKGAQ